MREDSSGHTWACPHCSALAPASASGRLPRAPKLRSALSLAIEVVSRHERGAPPLEGDPPEAEARARAVSLAEGYLGVAEVDGPMDLTLMAAYQAGIRGAALVEFCLDVAWLSRSQAQKRKPRCARPASHSDVWDALVTATSTTRVTDTVVRSQAPPRYASPLDIHRCIADLNPQQARAVLLSHLNLVSIIQGPPGTGKTTTLAHLVASHLGTLLPGSCIIVCAHTHAAVDVAFLKCLQVFRQLKLQVDMSRLGDAMACFHQDSACDAPTVPPLGLESRASAR